MSTSARMPGYRDLTWPQLGALVVGVVYAVIGVIGFFITGFDDFFGHQTDELLGFQINPFHNLVHLLVGLAGVALARTLAGSRMYGFVLGVGFGAAFVYGLFAVGESWDFLSLNWPDNILHLVSAAAGFAIALGPVRTAVGSRSARI
jgi:hypothetical protein